MWNSQSVERRQTPRSWPRRGKVSFAGVEGRKKFGLRQFDLPHHRAPSCLPLDGVRLACRPMNDGVPPPLLPPQSPAPPLPPPLPTYPLPSATPPRPRRGSGGWLAATLILLFLLAVSILANFALVGSKWGHFSRIKTHPGHRTEDLEEAVLVDNDSTNKVAVFDISGEISGDTGRGESYSMVELIRHQLDRAATDEVKAVILKIDSPGGEVLASDEIYRAIRQFQETNDIPVITSMGSLAASGGYYISAASRWIVANEMTITGSIGVIFHTYNYRGLMDKIGVRPSVVKSGRLKDMLSPDKRPEDELPEERQILSNMIQESFTRFKSVILEGRGGAAAKNREENNREGRELAPGWTDFADGRILSGREAMNLGLVDELGNFDTAVERALTLAGIDDANLVTYEAPQGWAGLSRLFAKSDARALKVEIGGFEMMPHLLPGRLYFMSPLHLH